MWDMAPSKPFPSSVCPTRARSTAPCVFAYTSAASTTGAASGPGVRHVGLAYNRPYAHGRLRAGGEGS